MHSLRLVTGVDPTMRFLFLTPGTGHFFCGSCLRDDALGRALEALGHEVSVAPLYLPMVLEREEPQEPAVHMGGINVYLQQKSRVAGMLPRFVRDLLDSPRLLRWASRRGNMTDASDLGELTVSILRGEEGRQAKELDKLIDWVLKQPRPDVVVISNAMLTGVVRRLRDTLNVPVVVTLQGEAPFLDGLAPADRDRAWSTLRVRAEETDAWIAVSSHYGDEMKTRLGLPTERVHVVHNGIDVADFTAPAAAPSAPTIGYLARMCRDKGLDTLVEAFAQLKERGAPPGLRLRVAGVQLREDQPFVEEQRERLRQADCLGDVDFLPNIDRAQKLDFLRSLTAFSVPARYGESFGLYLLEAMAAGVPVVQPRHAAFPEILDATGGGLLCPPEDPAALADALLELLNDPAHATRLGERGRAAVRDRFTSRRMAQQVAEICQGLASSTTS